MSEARPRIKKALEDRLTDEQLKIIMDEVLQMTKKARGWCPSCKKHVNVEIADAKAVVGALSDLLIQAEGRPKEAQEDGERITLVRQVFFNGAE